MSVKLKIIAAACAAALSFLYPISVSSAQDKINDEGLMVRDKNCDQLRKFVADLDAILTPEPRSVSPVLDFIKSVSLPSCDEKMTERIFLGSKFFQSERKFRNRHNNDYTYRIGSKYILVEIVYSPDEFGGKQFPKGGRTARIKKTNNDYN